MHVYRVLLISPLSINLSYVYWALLFINLSFVVCVTCTNVCWWWWLFVSGEFSTIHSPPALFFLIVEISSRTLIPLFMPGSVHSGSVSWDHCGRMFPDKLHVSSFLESSHTLPGQWHRHPTLTLNTCPKSDTCLLHTITSPFVIRVTYISIARYYPLLFIHATCMSTERYWPFLCHMCDMHVCRVPLWSLKLSEDPTLLSQVHWLEQCVLVS